MSNLNAAVESKVSLKVCEKNLIKNLGSIFTDKSKVLAELVQNARRAGSNDVVLNYNPETAILSVKDNGCGIDDLQNLLSIALSGWDDETQASESAYGMGWLATLFSCEEITVSSHGKTMTAKTTDILEQKEINVERCISKNEGAIIQLHGFAMDETTIEKHLIQIAKANAIDVIYQGKLLDSSLSFKALEVNVDYQKHDFEYGTVFVHVKGLPTKGYYAYLQGVSILKDNGYLNSLKNIVHLNNSVKARMPDRDALLEAEAVKESIKLSLESFWKARLSTLLEQLGQHDFVISWGVATLGWYPELLNEVDYLPVEMFSIQLEEPRFEQDWESTIGTPDFKLISKEMILNGVVKIVEFEDGDSDEGWLVDMYAYSSELLSICLSGLKGDHWIHDHVTELDNKNVSVEYIKPEKYHSFRGQWVWSTVELVDSYTLKGPLGDVVVSDAGVNVGSDCILVPSKELNGGWLVTQCSSFKSEHDEYNAEMKEADEEALNGLILRARCNNKAEVFAEALKLLPKDVVDALKGGSFDVSCDEKGVFLVKEVEDSLLVTEDKAN
jgi:hypothetical protein